MRTPVLMLIGAEGPIKLKPLPPYMRIRFFVRGWVCVCVCVSQRAPQATQSDITVRTCVQSISIAHRSVSIVLWIDSFRIRRGSNVFVVFSVTEGVSVARVRETCD